MPDNDYFIPENKKLIIIDAHDTIFKRDLSRSTQNIFQDPVDKDKMEWHLRAGLTNFLDYFKGIKKIKIVISSDGDQKHLQGLCTRFGIMNQIEAIYGYKHIHKETYLKQLDLILAETGVDPENAVFIGDSKIDEYSAKKYGVDFIKVPNTLENIAFSFNKFLKFDFSERPYGLELQRIVNLKKVYYNCPTPCLIEKSICRKEAQLAHRGALVVSSGKFQEHLAHGRYIVKEPSSENRIYWESDIFRPFDAQNFHLLQLRIQAFLQDREVFIQDCYVGAHEQHRKPIRIITQTAWHSLFARNMFIQGSEEQLARFFPEYTIMHMPYFKAIPELDGTDSEEFVIINLLKKIVLIGGTHYAGEIRRAVYMLLGYFYLKEDILPVKCSANQGVEAGDVALYYGESSTTKSSISLHPSRRFLGDAYHGWGKDSIFNLEWGSYVPVAGLSQEKSSVLFESCQRFSTILENVYISEDHRVQFNEPYSHYNARASFPITHVQNSLRTGMGARPKNVFIIIKDGLGILPPLVRLTREQAILYLLVGYNSEVVEEVDEISFKEASRFYPFFKDHPFVLKPSLYALYLWEKLESSESTCWLVNKSHFGNLQNGGWMTKTFVPRLIRDVLSGVINDAWLGKHSIWKFDYLITSPFPQEVENEFFHFDQVWKDKQELEKRTNILIHSFHQAIEPHRNDLEPKILDSLPILS